MQPYTFGEVLEVKASDTPEVIRMKSDHNRYIMAQRTLYANLKQHSDEQDRKHREATTTSLSTQDLAAMQAYNAAARKKEEEDAIQAEFWNRVLSKPKLGASLL